MKCSQRYESLMLYAHGELQSDDAAELESHLIECEACRERLCALQSMCSHLRDSLSQQEDAPDMVASILSALPHRSKPRPLRWVAASGLAVAAVFLLVWLNLSPAQVERSQRTVARTETQSAVSYPQAELPEQNQHADDSEPDIAVVAEQPKRPVPKQRPAPAPPVVKLVATAPPESVASPEEDTDSIAVLCVRVEPAPVIMDADGTRSSATVTMEVCGIEVTHTKEVVTLPPPPNPDAESIQRPELKTVSAGLFGRLNS